MSAQLLQSIPMGATPARGRCELAATVAFGRRDTGHCQHSVVAVRKTTLAIKRPIGLGDNQIRPIKLDQNSGGESSLTCADASSSVLRFPSRRLRFLLPRARRYPIHFPAQMFTNLVVASGSQNLPQPGITLECHFLGGHWPTSQESAGGIPFVAQ